MLRLLPALLLVSCAAEVPPSAEPGDPRVMSVGAVAALDGSYSEGDDLSFAWSVEPAEGAVLNDAESPFATLTAEAPGLYTLRLEVCDAAGRCDVAETWARVDDPASAKRITDWGIDEFAGVESGAGAPVDLFKGDKAWCAKCLKAAGQDSDDWWDMCKALPDDAEPYDYKKCKSLQNQSEEEKKGWCRNNGCRG